jgi:hypothetical protein
MDAAREGGNERDEKETEGARERGSEGAREGGERERTYKDIHTYS